MKIYGLIAGLTLLVNGCAYVSVNGTMCDQIASEPNAVMPVECRDYDEKKADKAFNRVVNDKKVADKDITFDKEEEK